MRNISGYICYIIFNLWTFCRSQIARYHALSLLCDRIWGNEDPFPTFVNARLMNLPADEDDESDNEGRLREAWMNHSIYSADRMTHLKIVVVALVAGIAVAGFGISARTFSDDSSTQTARVIKAGKPVVVTSSNTSMVR
jgi:hypothetical protein